MEFFTVDLRLELPLRSATVRSCQRRAIWQSNSDSLSTYNGWTFIITMFSASIKVSVKQYTVQYVGPQICTFTAEYAHLNFNLNSMCS